MKKSNEPRRNGGRKPQKSAKYSGDRDGNREPNGAPKSVEEAVQSVEKEEAPVDKSNNSAIQLEDGLLKGAEAMALAKLRESHEALVALASKRLESKLSNTRVVGVARELSELIKVMTVYEAA